MTTTPHGEPRCPHVAASQWGPARCVLPEGHDGRHAYGADEGESVNGLTAEQRAEHGRRAEEFVPAQLVYSLTSVECIARQVRRKVLTEACDAIAALIAGHRHDTSEPCDLSPALAAVAALAHPSTDPDG